MSSHPVGIKAGDLVCQHPEHNHSPGTTITWCSHIEETIKNGDEKVLIEPLHTYHVPVFPNSDKFAIIRLMDPLPPGHIKMCEMKMLYTPDIGRAYEVELGFWIQGDGFLAMRNMVLDYMRTRIHPEDSLNKLRSLYTRCPNSAHGVSAQNIMQQLAMNPESRSALLWDIVFEKACTPCINESGNASGNNFGVGGL